MACREVRGGMASTSRETGRLREVGELHRFIASLANSVTATCSSILRTDCVAVAVPWGLESLGGCRLSRKLDGREAVGGRYLLPRTGWIG